MKIKASETFNDHWKCGSHLENSFQKFNLEEFTIKQAQGLVSG